MNPFRPPARRQLRLLSTTLLTIAAASLLPCRLTASRAVAAEPPAAEQNEPEKAPDPPKPIADPVIFVQDSVRLMAVPMPVWSLAFSANDQFLAASGGGSWADQTPGLVRVWDVAKLQEVASYLTPRGAPSVALSPDGRRLAWSTWSNGVWLREVGGQELFHEQLNATPRVAISPDGKLLVAATASGEVHAWDAVSGKASENFPGVAPPFRFLWVGFSPDGKYLVATGGNATEVAGPRIAVWDVATRKERYHRPCDAAPIAWGAISPDSKTLATTGVDTVALWDLAAGTITSRTDPQPGNVNRVEFSPDGSRLATARAHDNGGLPRNLGVHVTMVNPATGEDVGRLGTHRFDVRALAFTHDGKTLATGSADRSLRLWNVASGAQTGVLQGPKALPDSDEFADAILAVAYSPDGGSVATADEDGQVTIYDLSPSSLPRSWLAHGDAAAALAYSPDGKTLVSGGYDKEVKFWDSATGKLIRTLTGHAGRVVSLAFSHDGRTLASGSYDRSIRLWNGADGTLRQTLAGHTATVRSVAFSHDDRRLASGSSDRTVRLWDVENGQAVATLNGHGGAVRCVAFSPDDRLLASGGEDKLIKIWNVESHDLRGTLTGHADMVSAVAFAQQTLVSTSWDHTLQTWNAEELMSRGYYSGDPSPIVALALTPDGRRLLTAQADKSLNLWKERVIEVARPSPGSHLFRDDFSGKYSPIWKIIRGDQSHLSLSANPGRLTIITQKGAIHGDSGNDDESEAAKNIFLIALPVDDQSEFRLTLAVTKFQPTTYFQQVALLCYDDDDNYVKWSYEYSWAKPTTNFVMVRETDMKPEHDLVVELSPPEKLWMRITKRRADYECAYSTDGKDFKVAGSRPWGKGPPKYVGFMAKNGGNPDAPEIEVQIDSFELASPPSAADKQP